MNRRAFASAIGRAAGVTALHFEAAPSGRKLKAGHTGITWSNNVPQALEACGKLDFQGFETVGQISEAWDAIRGMERVLEPNHVPLVSARCTFNMVPWTKASGTPEGAKYSRAVGNDLVIMAELDSAPYMPVSATRAATSNREYLRKMGYGV